MCCVDQLRSQSAAVARHSTTRLTASGQHQSLKQLGSTLNSVANLSINHFSVWRGAEVKCRAHEAVPGNKASHQAIVIPISPIEPG